MSTSFSIDLKKKKSSNKSKGKKKRNNNNIFGDVTTPDTSTIDNIHNNQKRRKIKITEVSQDDLSNEKPKKDDLVIVLGDRNDETEELAATTLDDYKTVPVEQFGSAILRGMGWDGTSTDVIDKKSENTLKSAHIEGLGIGAKGDAQITDTESFMPLIKLDKKQNR
ncbi:similar to Saccharomyces cerevisiae YOR148C SPP2 Essential protein that promotes the first step of splicing and is required for the final stages of spliceosome maturation [Maudiozyma saulgeensis]|uniref:Pre-mRNA-splicing factor n=1 Tax=Maudiozyma saulgeensis TaxID=1789683 RepID=A0A1X7QYW6_9SACH|nr:similar to Saccharomyces cerevisiae YOR148C SPP2 Essential protein that promotes the first step of splicing and is required for the final stages of spliceosome maturation [Kazachstania saulgeensis]